MLELILSLVLTKENFISKMNEIYSQSSTCRIEITSQMEVVLGIAYEELKVLESSKTFKSKQFSFNKLQELVLKMEGLLLQCETASPIEDSYFETYQETSTIPVKDPTLGIGMPPFFDGNWPLIASPIE